jgi:hypothetical protein
MISCLENKSGIKFNVETVEQLLEQVAYFNNNEEFISKYGDPQIVVEGMTLEQYLKKVEIDKKYKECTEYILTYYPKEKQQSDFVDKIYYETLLRSMRIQDIDKDIVDRVIRFLNGESLDSILSDIDDTVKLYYEQLLKTAIRVNWVQACKRILKESIENNTEPEYPPFPKI